MRPFHLNRLNVNEIDSIKNLKWIFFDFDGIFTDNSVYVDQNGIESVRCSRSDGLGLKKLDEIGIKYAVISTEINPVVTTRCQKLKIPCHQGIENKEIFLEKLKSEYELLNTQIAYMGNDINDIGCLSMVGFPITVIDSHPDVLNLGTYITQNSGGNGAVREVCDLFFHIRTKL